MVFLSGAVVMFLSNLFYIIFGSAKTQHWNTFNTGTVSTVDIKNQNSVQTRIRRLHK